MNSKSILRTDRAFEFVTNWTNFVHLNLFVITTFVESLIELLDRGIAFVSLLVGHEEWSDCYCVETEWSWELVFDWVNEVVDAVCARFSNYEKSCDNGKSSTYSCKWLWEVVVLSVIVLEVSCSKSIVKKRNRLSVFSCLSEQTTFRFTPQSLLKVSLRAMRWLELMKCPKWMLVVWGYVWVRSSEWIDSLLEHEDCHINWNLFECHRVRKRFRTLILYSHLLN